MKLLRLLLVALSVLLTATPHVEASTARMRLARMIEAPPVEPEEPEEPTGDLPATQTVYWGPKTLNGHAGYNACRNALTGWVDVCEGSVTVTASANYTEDAALDGVIVPKNGSGSNTYGAARSSPLTGTEVVTITTSSGQTSTIYNVADAARAGTFTTTDRAVSDGVSGAVPQLVAALQLAVYGDVIAQRDGTEFNTPDHAGVYNGWTPYRVRNNRTIPGNYASDGPVTIRPETGGKAMFGNLILDGQNNTVPGGKRLDGLRFQGLDFYGEIDETSLIQALNLVNNIDIFDSTFRSVEGDWLNANVDRSSAITKDANSARWRLHRNTFEFLENGVVLPNSAGTADMGASAYSDPAGVYHEVVDNTFRAIYSDALAMPCATGPVITGNVLTDKATAVAIGASAGFPNPFNTGVQPHGDAFQFDYKSCGYGRYAGPIITGNVITRGMGRDSMPFWTVANGYPSSNTPGPACCLTPNPAFGYGDYQGVFRSNTGTSVYRSNYSAVWVSPQIAHNFIQIVMGNGMSLGPIENPVVEFNTVLADYPGPANLVTSPFGAVSLFSAEVSGTSGRARYNVATAQVSFPLASGAALDLGSGGGQAGTTNLVVPIASYGAAFNAPQPKRRSREEASAAFRPKVGGPLFVNDNQPAGVWCPSGALRTAAAC